MESVTGMESWERFRTMSYQKVASQLTIPEVEQWSLFLQTHRRFGVCCIAVRCVTIFQVFLFFNHLSFFLHKCCGLSLNAAWLDGSWAGGDQWQSCLIRNIEGESIDRQAEQQQRGEDTQTHKLWKQLYDWKTAKVGQAVFMKLV